jgi:hypothetical protein
MRVRFPPLPPNSSSVTVAEWLRRQTVDLSTRVQFPPVTPFRTWGPLPLVVAQNRRGYRTATIRERNRPPVQVVVGVAQLELERGFPKPEAAGSIPAAHTRFCDFRGLGKRINPLGLGPRDSRFESEVPDQVLWGSQAARRLAVNQFMRRFESCPHSQNAGVAFWLRATVLQTDAVEFDPLPRYHACFARLWPSGFRHRSSKAVHAGSIPARRSIPMVAHALSLCVKFCVRS